MDTRLLKVFESVARHGGLAGAAIEMHLTPSALSHRLKALESELGCRLFERSGRRLLLNQAGEQLLAGIGKPLAALEETAARMRALGRWGQSRLRIGASVSLCESVVPRVVAQLRRDSASLHVVVESADMTELLQLVRERHIDLAVGVEPEPESGLEFRNLFEDELLWVMGSAHPWTDGRPLAKADVRKEPLILYRRGSATAQLVRRHLVAMGVDPMVVMEVSSVRAIKEMVREGLGIAVLAPWAVAAELTDQSLTVRAIGAKALKRRWVLAYNSGRRLSLAEEQFFRFMERECGALWRDRGMIPAEGEKLSLASAGAA